MSEVLEAPARPGARQLHRRRVATERLGSHLREARPLAAVRDDRRVPRLRRGGRERGRRGGARRLPGVGADARGEARRDPEQGRRRRRAARGADRPGHDARDGQADPRVARWRRCGCRRSSASTPARACGPTGERFEQMLTGSVAYTVHRPLGVVGLITPWNFPAAIPAWKAAPALVYGNTVVMKLAQEAPLTGLHLAACLEEAGMPAGVFNIVIGRGSEVGTPLVEHPRREGDLVHRLRPGRRAGARRGDEARQARPARARRPQPGGRDGRRRPRSARSSSSTPARSGRPARSARRRGGSTSRSRSTTSSAAACSSGWRAASSATRTTRPPRSGRS